ncbi:MAG: SGNH/GDSL hydrolase N-terminal domain-containing protein [Thermoguttaceae bacterium]
MATVVWRLALLGACGLGASPDLSASERIDPQRARISPDGATLWYDCKDLAVEGKGWADTKAFYDRLPARAEGKVPPSVWNLSHDSTGLCVFFATDAPSLQVHWTTTSANLAMPHMPATGVSGVDLYAKDKSGRWCFVGNGRPAAASNTALFTPPPGSPCLLYLPLYNGVTFRRDRHPKRPNPFHARCPRSQAAQAGCVLRDLDYSGWLRIATGHGFYSDRGPAT